MNMVVVISKLKDQGMHVSITNFVQYSKLADIVKHVMQDEIPDEID